MVSLTADGRKIWRHDPDMEHRVSKIVSCTGSWTEPVGGPAIALGQAMTTPTLFEMDEEPQAA